MTLRLAIFVLRRMLWLLLVAALATILVPTRIGRRLLRRLVWL